MSTLLKLFLALFILSAVVFAQAFRGEGAEARGSGFSAKVERISGAVLDDHFAAQKNARASLGLRGDGMGIEFRNLSAKNFSNRMEAFGFVCAGAGSTRIGCRKQLESEGARLTLDLTFSEEKEAVVFRHGRALRTR